MKLIIKFKLHSPNAKQFLTLIQLVWLLENQKDIDQIRSDFFQKISPDKFHMQLLNAIGSAVIATDLEGRIIYAINIQKSCMSGIPKN